METKMETLQWTNEQLSFYRNSEYKWVRELTLLFEQYFDKEFRDDLTLANFQEDDLKKLLLFSLDILYKIISQDGYFIGEETQSIGFFMAYLGHPARDTNKSINKERVQKLFDYIAMPYRLFAMTTLLVHRDLFKAVEDNINLQETRKRLKYKNEALEYAIKELRGEYEIKDREMEIRNEMIQKLRKGIDEDGGMDKFKALIDKCYKQKASANEIENAKSILENLAEDCRNNKSTYKNLSYSKLGKKLGVHHTTAKRYCVLLGVKKYL